MTERVPPYPNNPAPINIIETEEKVSSAMGNGFCSGDCLSSCKLYQSSIFCPTKVMIPAAIMKENIVSVEIPFRYIIAANERISTVAKTLRFTFSRITMSPKPRPIITANAGSK